MPTALEQMYEPGGQAPSRFRTAATARQAASDRRRLEQDLRAAVERGGFVLQYQPRLRLATGEVRGAEALIRWPHRRHGMVPPSVFLPVAERCALTAQIGGWVLQAACAEAASWPGLCVSVNVSARQLHGGALLDQLGAALDSSGLAPQRLELELGEPALAVGGTETLLTLSAIRDLGVGVVLDEFGAGGASLSLLRQMPLSAMKLDRSLVRDLPADRECAAIVRALVGTAHALGLSVVAEGIETEAQRAILSAVGCDEGQGSLFSHPLPGAEFHARILR